MFSATTHQCLATLEGHDGEISKVSHWTQNSLSTMAREKLFYVTIESQCFTSFRLAFILVSIESFSFQKAKA